MRLYAASDMALEQEGDLPEDTITTTAAEVATAGTVATMTAAAATADDTATSAAAGSIVHGEGVGTNV